MSFLNPLPLFFWLIPVIPILIFLINRRNYRIVKFSSIKHLVNLRTSEINRIKFLNILLLLLRTLILIVILIIIMRPHTDDWAMASNNSDNKIINYIFIDDSFSNKYGITNDKDRIYLIDQIVDDICQKYPLKSKLKIATLNKGIIFDGFNSHELIFSFIDSKMYEFNPMDDFFIEDQGYINNVHLISNSNQLFVNKSKEILESARDQKQFIFYHSMPSISNNQYISTVDLVDNNDGIFYYKLVIGNQFNESSNLNLSVYKNIYEYNTELVLNQQIPLFTKKINLESNSYFVDTVAIQLNPDKFSEILFKLENSETQNNWVDFRLEDNYYSYIMDIPKKIDISIIYNDLEDQKYLESILNSFQVITNDIDTNFFNIDYVYTNGISKYSDIINKKDIVMFLGYDIFVNTDQSVINDFLKNKDSQIILLPNKGDSQKNKYVFNVSDSLIIESSYFSNIVGTYDTTRINDDIKLEFQNFINTKLKLYNYFYHQSNLGSKFKINDNAIWSRFKIGQGYFDLFGFVINSGNNLFSSESFFSAPFLYYVTLNSRIDYSKNNLDLNQEFNVDSRLLDRLKLINLENDSIIFYNHQHPIISTKSTKGLISNGNLLSLYSFNPIKSNFNKFFSIEIVKDVLTENIIDYSSALNVNNNFNRVLNNSELTKYFIYFLLLLLLLEMILSNAKPSRER